MKKNELSENIKMIMVSLKKPTCGEFKNFTLNEFAGFEEYASDLLSDNQLIF